MKPQQDMLPLVLFELSVMRQTVRGFGPAAEDDALRLLARLAALESKAWRLIAVRKGDNPSPLDH